MIKVEEEIYKKIEKVLKDIAHLQPHFYRERLKNCSVIRNSFDKTRSDYSQIDTICRECKNWVNCKYYDRDQQLQHYVIEQIIKKF
jgi:hypothetical protein